MTAPCGGTAAELDAPARRALERLARELPAGASTVVAPGRERVSFALDHATPGHDRHPGQTSRHTWADAGTADAHRRGQVDRDPGADHRHRGVRALAVHPWHRRPVQRL